VFVIYQAASWQEVKEHFADRPLWAFRGQSNSRWSLETTLYREAVRRDGLVPALASRESWILYQFKRFSQHYRSDLPPENDVLAWLSLIQHYGGPTRLLDFSYSLYVAAFFAVESAENDAAIWAISLDVLELAAHSRLNISASGSIIDFRRANNEKFQELVNRPSDTEAVLHVEPDQLHERMWIQQSLFLAPTCPNKPFMTNLASVFGKKAGSFSRAKKVKEWPQTLEDKSWLDFGEPGCLGVIKIELPREIHREILDDLQAMNINAATLFPGLEGFARSLKYFV